MEIKFDWYTLIDMQISNMQYVGKCWIEPSYSPPRFGKVEL